MTAEQLAALMELPVARLREQARIPFHLTPDRAALIEHFAQSILEQVRGANARRESLRLILPVGPVAQYRRVVEISNRERISWRNVWVFLMDEFLDWQGRPLGLSHPLSFEGFMRREFFGRLEEALRIPAEQVLAPHPFRIDEISQKIGELGGVDCCYGGVGYHGHVAFNEPPISRWRRISVEELRQSLTRVVWLGEDSIVVQSILCAGGNSAAIPPMAVTLGMRDILASRRIRLYLAGGERHRAIFRITVAGEVTTDFPSTLVQGHPDALVVTEEATAAPIEVGLR
jgi:glucosamine-6-phosphate deaminase